MIIGILAESSNDSEPLKEIIKKILTAELNTNLNFITFESNTGIFADMNKAAKLFFDAEPNCHIAIYLNDLDDQPNRCKKIRQWATTYCSKNAQGIIVVGCPDPTFEQWFVSEENAIKNVLGLDSTKPLPHDGQHPKARMEKMIYENPDITISKKSAYIDIAKKLNLTVLKDRDRSFKRFYEEFQESLAAKNK